MSDSRRGDRIRITSGRFAGREAYYYDEELNHMGFFACDNKALKLEQGTVLMPLHAGEFEFIEEENN